jgi:hypothetical protein
MRPAVPPFRRRPSRRWNLLTALAATAYLAWSFVPVWYRAQGGTTGGVTLRPVLLNAWGGPTGPAAILAIVAVAWVGARTGREVRQPERVVAVDAALAVAALVLTLSGVILLREGPLGGATPSWGLAAGIVLAVAWTF